MTENKNGSAPSLSDKIGKAHLVLSFLIFVLGGLITGTILGTKYFEEWITQSGRIDDLSREIEKAHSENESLMTRLEELRNVNDSAITNSFSLFSSLITCNQNGAVCGDLKKQLTALERAVYSFNIYEMSGQKHNDIISILKIRGFGGASITVVPYREDSFGEIEIPYSSPKLLVISEHLPADITCEMIGMLFEPSIAGLHFSNVAHNHDIEIKGTNRNESVEISEKMLVFGLPFNKISLKEHVVLKPTLKLKEACISDAHSIHSQI